MAVHLMCKACVCAPTLHQMIQSDSLDFVLCAEALACDLRSDETLLYLGVWPYDHRLPGIQEMYAENSLNTKHSAQGSFIVEGSN